MHDDYFDRIERQLSARAVARGRRRLRLLPDGFPAMRREWLAPAAAIAVVVIVVAAFVGLHSSSNRPARTNPLSGQHPNGSQKLNAFPKNGTTVELGSSGASAAALRTAQHRLLARLHVAFPHTAVIVAVGNKGARGEISAIVGSRAPGTAALISALAGRGTIAFYDWEANVLTPSGATVASQLSTQNPSALLISQGRNTGSPGDATAGAMTHAAAEAVAARYNRSHQTKAVLVQATSGTLYSVAPASPAARFFVIIDRPAISGTGALDAVHVSQDPTGQPDVAFRFSPAAGDHFRTVTRTVAHRGAQDSSLGHELLQHFAIVVDGRLVEVPSIAYNQYPDGIQGTDGAEIVGDLTTAQARALAALLGSKPLPVNLKQVK